MANRTVRAPMTEEQKAAFYARVQESERRFAEALARMPDLPPDQMSEEGCVNLVTEFWARVKHDLSCRNRATRAWVEGDDGFLVWCKIGGADPEATREFMLTRVWGNPAFSRIPRHE